MATTGEYVSILIGGFISTADTVTNVASVVMLWHDDERVWFTLLLVFVLAAAVLTAAHSAASAGSSLLKSIAPLLGLHHLSQMFLSLRAGEKTDEFIGGRLFQAVLEAGPAAVLQLYILLRLDNFHWFRVLSMTLSGLTIASTLALDTAPMDASVRETIAIFVFCLAEIVSTMICMSLFAFLYKVWIFAAVALHYVLILFCWRWWSRHSAGRRCDTFGMGLFSALLNLLAIIHTGDDLSYVYSFGAKHNSEGPHFLRGGAQMGAFLGLAAVQDIARVGYIVGAVANKENEATHIWLIVVMGCAFVVQHLALVAYFFFWRSRHGVDRIPSKSRSKRFRSTSKDSREGSRRSRGGSVEMGIDVVNPVHRASFASRAGLANSVASW